MSIELLRIGIDCGTALLLLVLLTFIINRLGLCIWVGWVNRRKRLDEDSSAKQYWSVHE
jgi:hypothetical protein